METLAGGAGRFEALVVEHGPVIRRLCASILRDEHLAADASQDVLLRLWRALESSSPPSAVGAWIRSTAIRSAIDQARRRRVREEAAEQARPADEPEVAGPGEAALQAEFATHLEDALEHLSEGQRTVFLLRHEAGLPLARVAELLDVETSTVKTQFARACLRLQERLARFAPERPGGTS